jgi:hypothetical protein
VKKKELVLKSNEDAIKQKEQNEKWFYFNFLFFFLNKITKRVDY